MSEEANNMWREAMTLMKEVVQFWKDRCQGLEQELAIARGEVDETQDPEADPPNLELGL